MRVRSDVDAKAFSKRIFGIVMMMAMSGGPLTTPLLAQVVNTPPAPASQTAPVSPASTAQPDAVGAVAQPPGTQITKTVTTTVTNAPAGSAPVHTDLPTNLSVQGMLLAADPIVKVVMALLALASIATWSICLYKIIELLLASAKARSAMRILHAARSLRQATASLPNGAVARLVTSAETEMELSNLLPAGGVKERVGIALERVENAESRRIGIGTSILASVGSTAPFVGLFGTVWGIMNSFIHISNAHTTNLSVVAPGIAEALLATAMGLVAAIPAVLIYNTFSRWIGGYRSLLGDCSAAIMRHVSRHLDQRDFDTDTRLAAE